MIQELLGAGSGRLITQEKSKVSINDGILESATPPSSLLSSPPSNSYSTKTPPATTSNTNTTSTTSSNNSENQNLRCPRCDSSNTKFCYYNNYNLTQPRHFCKTCRRYWTKGGALRNVPIGGGCRKNKTSSNNLATSGLGKSSAAAGKMKILSSSDQIIGRSSGFGINGFDHHELISPSPNQILWGSPQSSPLLAILRAAQNPNPSSVTVKAEETMVGLGSHMMTEPVGVSGSLHAPTSLASHPLSQVRSLGLGSSCYWANHDLYKVQEQQNHGFAVGEVQNTSGLEELYRRLRSSTSCFTDHRPELVMSNNVGSSSSSFSSSSVLESGSISGSGELGHWNVPTFSWSEFPASTTTNGAYP